MEKLLKEVLSEIKNQNNKLNELEIAFKGIKDEHGQMLRAILENKEIQRGEIENIKHRAAKLEGAIKGAANQILNSFKEVSNQ